MDGYVRVSRRMGREGPGYISPDVQREAILRWAEYKGVEVVAWHVDEDWSGGTQERPGLELAVERAVAGETGGISWKIDRFSRYTESGLRDLRRLEEAGARLAFVVEDIDTSGPMGKFVYTVMLAMAEYFLDSIKASWRTAKTRAHERGAKIGPTPFGYRRVKDGTLKPHPDRARTVQQAFRLAAQDGLGAAVDYLDGLGLEHEQGERKGRPLSWTTSTVRRTLANRTYLGEVAWGDLQTVHVEELALVSRGVWEAAQHEQNGRRRPARHYPLSGLVECGRCGEPMVGGSAGRAKDGGSLRTYRCRASLKSWKGERCKGVNVVADNLEAWAVERMNDDLRRVFAELPPIEVQEGEDVERAEAALNAAEEERARFAADLRARSLMGDDLWYETLEQHAAAVEAAREAFAAAAKTSQARKIPFDGRELELAEVAELFRNRSAVAAVFPARGKPIEERADVAFGPSLTLKTSRPVRAPRASLGGPLVPGGSEGAGSRATATVAVHGTRTGRATIGCFGGSGPDSVGLNPHGGSGHDRFRC